MCLAIFRPPNVDIHENLLAAGWRGNSDGGGFAFYKKGKVHITKGFTKWQEWLDAYRKAVAKNPDAPFLLHFRIRSMGSRSAENTHPYAFAHGCMIHNGTLSGTAATHDGPSDTALFLEKFGDKFTSERVKAIKDELGKAISFNKLVFLFNDGSHAIINESQGTWRDGAWLSNTYSLRGFDYSSSSLYPGFGGVYDD